MQSTSSGNLPDCQVVPARLSSCGREGVLVLGAGASSDAQLWVQLGPDEVSGAPDMQAVQVEDLCHQQLKEDGRVLSHPSLKGSGAGSSAVMERESNLSEALVMVH